MKLLLFTASLCATLVTIDQFAADGRNTETFLRLCKNTAHAVRDAGHEISTSILA